MLVEQKLNRSKALHRVASYLQQLRNSEKTIKDIFNISFCKPSFTFLEVVNNNSSTEITYETARKMIVNYASYFSSVISNDEKYVGLHLDSSPEWIYCFYGLLMSNHVPVLLSTQNEIIESESVLKKLGSKTYISKTKFNEDFRNIYKEYIKSVKTYTEKWENEIIFLTSGTEGEPKILKYRGEEMCTQIETSLITLKKSPTSASTYEGYLKQLVILPFYHIFGFVAVFLWFSFFNISFVFPRSLSPMHIQEACMIAKPTHLFAVPLFFNTIYGSITKEVKKQGKEKLFKRAIKLSSFIQTVFPKSGPKFVRNVLFKNYLDLILGPSVKYMITGGGLIDKETLTTINGLGYSLVNGFGSTEIGISSFSNPNKLKTRNSISVGAPLPNYKYKIKDDLLYVQANSSYYARFDNGQWILKKKNDYLNTNDRAEINKKGICTIKGRNDDLVVLTNGENISIEGIEKMINPNNNKFCVLVKNKSKFSLLFLNNIPLEQIVEIVEKANSIKTIKNLLTKDIYSYAKPFAYANGIKLKRSLIQHDFDNNKHIEVIVAKKDSTLYEKSTLDCIIDFIKKNLNIEDVKEDSDYFSDLGGDSLSYMDLILNLESHYKISFDLRKNILKTPGCLAKEIKRLIHEMAN